MRLIKIGKSIYNFDYLVEANVERAGVILTFLENVKVTIAKENWEELSKVLDVETEIPNDYKFQGGSF